MQNKQTNKQTQESVTHSWEKKVNGNCLWVIQMLLLTDRLQSCYFKYAQKWKETMVKEFEENIMKITQQARISIKTRIFKKKNQMKILDLKDIIQWKLYYMGSTIDLRYQKEPVNLKVDK